MSDFGYLQSLKPALMEDVKIRLGIRPMTIELVGDLKRPDGHRWFYKVYFSQELGEDHLLLLQELSEVYGVPIDVSHKTQHHTAA